MSRNITCNFTAYEECIPAFRQDTWATHEWDSGPSVSYVLCPFSLDFPIGFEDFSTEPTYRKIVSGHRAINVLPVRNPAWIGRQSSHLFAIVLASLITAVTGAPCRAPRDDPHKNTQPGAGGLPDEFLLDYVVPYAGTGRSTVEFSHAEQLKFIVDLKGLIANLRLLSAEQCAGGLRALRLLQLGILNLRDDPGLAFALAVGSIESAAQQATLVDDFRQPLPQLTDIKELSKTNAAIKALYKEYRRLGNNERYLAARFAAFIEHLVPVHEWESVTRHPDQEYKNQLLQGGELPSEVDRKIAIHADIYGPGVTQLEDPTKLLKKLYQYRSTYVHQGEQPPHRYPNGLEHIFAQIKHPPKKLSEQGKIYEMAPKQLSGLERTMWAVKECPQAFFSETELIPTFHLTAALARESLCRWIASGCKVLRNGPSE